MLHSVRSLRGLRTLNVLLLFCAGLAARLEAADYFVSAIGNDSNPGTKDLPFRSIARVNALDLEPGDRVWLRGSDTFPGSLDLQPADSGDAARPIRWDSYGGSRATIDAGTGPALLAYNCAGIEIRNLRMIGSGANTNTSAGIGIWTDRNDVDLVHWVLDGLEVAGFGDVGVYIGSHSTNFHGFRRVRVLRCDIHDNLRDGMFTWGTYTKRATDPYSNKDFYIGHCRFYANPGMAGKNSGNGLYLKDVQGAIVEHCEAFDNGSVGGLQNGGGPVGIWAVQSDLVTIRYCHSHHNQSGGNRDGGGFDFDGGVTRSEMYGNLSHDNEGPGFLLMDDRSWARPHRGNRVHDNISQNDGSGYQGAVFLYAASGSAVQELDFFHNVIYLGRGSGAALRQIGPAPVGARICNNVFFATQGRTLVRADQTSGFTFLGNDYFAQDGGFLIRWKDLRYTSLSAWSTATGQENYAGKARGTSADPRLENAGGAASDGDLIALQAYHLRSDSPLRDQAFDLEEFLGVERGTRDFFGTRLFDGTALDTGAHEIAVVPGVELIVPDRVQSGSLLQMFARNGTSAPAVYALFASLTSTNGKVLVLISVGSLDGDAYRAVQLDIPAELEGTGIEFITWSLVEGGLGLHTDVAPLVVDDF